MKKLLTIFIVLIIYSNYANGFCSCSNYLSFIKAAKYSDLIVEGTIEEIIYKFEDGTSFSTKEERDNYYQSNKGKLYAHAELIVINDYKFIQKQGESKELAEYLQDENMPIQILGGNINSCMSTFDNYNLGESHIFLLGLSDEIFSDKFFNPVEVILFEMFICGISHAKLDKTKVTIQSNRNPNKYKSISYKRLLRKLRFRPKFIQNK